MVFVDSSDRVFLYNGADTSILEITDVGATVSKVMWDSIDECVFVVATDDNLFTYVYSEFTVWGPRARRVGPSKFNKDNELEVSDGGTRLPDGFTPILVRNGIVTGQYKNGTIDKITLRTHTDADVRSIRKSDNKQGLPTCFAQNLTLLRLRPAWSIASMEESEHLWRSLSEKSMEVLNVKMAIKVGVAGAAGAAGVAVLVLVMRLVPVLVLALCLAGLRVLLRVGGKWLARVSGWLWRARGVARTTSRTVTHLHVIIIVVVMTSCTHAPTTTSLRSTGTWATREWC